METWSPSRWGEGGAGRPPNRRGGQDGTRPGRTPPRDRGHERAPASQPARGPPGRARRRRSARPASRPASQPAGGDRRSRAAGAAGEGRAGTGRGSRQTARPAWARPYGRGQRSRGNAHAERRNRSPTPAPRAHRAGRTRQAGRGRLLRRADSAAAGTRPRASPWDAGTERWRTGSGRTAAGATAALGVARARPRSGRETPAGVPRLLPEAADERERRAIGSGLDRGRPQVVACAPPAPSVRPTPPMRVPTASTTWLATDPGATVTVLSWAQPPRCR